MPERIQLSDSLRTALLNPDNLPSSFSVKGQSYFSPEPVTAGFKAAVWKVIDEYERERAAKLAMYEDYEDRSFLQELSRAAKLEPYPEFAKFVAADIVELEIGDQGKQRFVCFIEEWIEGWTLKDFLDKERDHVTSSFLMMYVKGMCAALNALQAVVLRHDDLHFGNVMVKRPVAGMLSSELSIKVIDTGSLKPSDAASTKPKNDHRNFVEHIVAIHNAIRMKKCLTLRERRFLQECIGLLDSMLDDDPSVALRSPEQILSQFVLAYSRSSFFRAPYSRPLGSPFEYISAEHIADDRLLVDIFADSCPWLDKVAGPDPCLVAGPRGCGKSTIFRWLSLKAHLHKPPVEVEPFRIAGFYISCSSDLQNRLGWIKTQALAERFRREIVHYFNLLLAREVIHTLCIIRDRQDRETFWGMGERQEQAINEFLREQLQTSHPLMQGVPRIRQSLEMLETEMFRCHVQMLKGLNLQWTTPETFLGDLTTLLAEHMPFFHERRIAFLLDDFSSHRLPETVQIVLNRVIWERRGTHIFKLSSEKYGAALTDSFQATVDVAREMLEIDCGREYVALDDIDQVEKARKFASELLANRLRAAEYKGAPEVLLGHSEWPQGSLGRALRDKDKGRADDQYHGIECIADLCSGDVSTLLLVYRRVFDKGGVTKDSNTIVPKRVQHEAIESVSRELLDAIRTHLPYGPQMHSIAQEFGTFVRKILKEGRLIKKGERGQVPPMCPRIEVDRGSSGLDESLNPEQEKLARELIRRAVFIEMEPGRSRHRFVTTLRWQLRRVYLPAFGAALSKNDAVKWDPSDFKYFLTDPNGACQKEWQRRSRSKEAKGGSSQNGTLFD